MTKPQDNIEILAADIWEDARRLASPDLTGQSLNSERMIARIVRRLSHTALLMAQEEMQRRETIQAVKLKEENVKLRFKLREYQSTLAQEKKDHGKIATPRTDTGPIRPK